DVAGDLVRAGPLLGRAKHVIDVEPLVQGNLGGLEHGPDRHGVLLATVVALDHALANRAFGMRLGLAATLRRQALGVERAAMRADRTFGPVQRLEVLAGRIFVLETGLENVGHRSVSLNAQTVPQKPCFVKYTVPNI